MAVSANNAMAMPAATAALTPTALSLVKIVR